jgi:hypothetical protein
MYQRLSAASVPTVRISRSVRKARLKYTAFSRTGGVSTIHGKTCRAPRLSVNSRSTKAIGRKAT